MTKTKTKWRKNKPEAKGESIQQASKIYRSEKGPLALKIIKDQNTKHSKVTNPSKFNFAGAYCQNNE